MPLLLFQVLAMPSLLHVWAIHGEVVRALIVANGSLRHNRLVSTCKSASPMPQLCAPAVQAGNGIEPAVWRLSHWRGTNYRHARNSFPLVHRQLTPITQRTRDSEFNFSESDLDRCLGLGYDGTVPSIYRGAPGRHGTPPARTWNRGILIWQMM